MAKEKKTNAEVWDELYADEPEKRKAIQDAVTKHGDEEIVPVDLSKPIGALAIFKTPDPGQHGRFLAAVLSDRAESKAKAAEILARATVIYPAREEFGRWCDEYSAIGGAVAKHILRLAGGEATLRGKD